MKKNMLTCTMGEKKNVLMHYGQTLYYKQVQETNDRTPPLSTAFSNACELEVSCLFSPQEHNKGTQQRQFSVEAFKQYLKEEVS